MEAVSTSETSVNLYRTTYSNIPEDSRIEDIHTKESVYTGTFKYFIKSADV
jgi:hypothetical protein